MSRISGNFKERMSANDAGQVDPGHGFHAAPGAVAFIRLRHSNRGKHIPTAVFDQSLSPESRDLLESFTASGYFDLTYAAKGYTEITELIDSGKAKVGIILPPDFDRNLRRGESASVQVLVDASDNMVANSAIAIANSIGLLKSQKILIQKAHIQQLPYDIRVRPWYNPDGITAFFMVPAILGIIVTMTMVMMTSMGIVRERERGTLEQLLVTPSGPMN